MALKTFFDEKTSFIFLTLIFVNNVILPTLVGKLL